MSMLHIKVFIRLSQGASHWHWEKKGVDSIGSVDIVRIKINKAYV